MTRQSAPSEPRSPRLRHAAMRQLRAWYRCRPSRRRVVSGVQKVHAIIGGMHLVPPLTEDYIREAVANLKVINPDYIIPAQAKPSMKLQKLNAGKSDPLDRRDTVQVRSM